MTGEKPDQIQSIAAELANLSSDTAVARILREHSADSTGHCRGCRYPTTAAPVWPCRLWEIADRARRTIQLRPPA